MLTVVASADKKKISAEIAHFSPTIICAISSQLPHQQAANQDDNEASFGREVAQRGVVIEYAAVANFASEGDDSSILSQQNCVLEIRYDFTRFVSFLRRSVTVVAEAVPTSGKKQQQQQQQKRTTVAVPGYVEAVEEQNDDDDGDDAQNKTKQKKRKTIKWIGRLDMDKQGEQLFGGKAAAAFSKSMLRFRLVLGGHLVHAASKKHNTTGTFSLMAPLFPCPSPTKLVARVSAVASGRRVEVASAYAVEKFEGASADNDGAAAAAPDASSTSPPPASSTFRSIAALEIAYLPFKESLNSSAVAKTASSIEVRAEDPERLHELQNEQARAVDLLLELQIVANDAVDDRLLRLAENYLPRWLMSPWIVIGFFCLVFLALVAMAIFLSTRQDYQDEDITEDF